MKKHTSLFIVVACLAVAGCRLHHHGNTSIVLNESDHYYSMKAWFNENRTREVEYYMDEHMGNLSKMSFVNTRIDGKLSFKDHTSFYIKKLPGYLQIKLDKNQNSDDSYYRTRDMCEGIKDLLAK
jgi:hypothetical protein